MLRARLRHSSRGCERVLGFTFYGLGRMRGVARRLGVDDLRLSNHGFGTIADPVVL